jgi:ribonucleoside-diphosphate reductase alpha chain
VLNVRQALKNGEPGFNFNFFEKVFENLRNACTEVTSEDDSDVCNLASVNMSRIFTRERMQRVCYLASKFLLCGTMVAQLPYQKVYEVRQQNRRLGLGLMGIHEWLLQRGEKYEVTPELHGWLWDYKQNSEWGANELADELGLSRPKGYRAIAPTGTIGIMAATTTGIEPLFALATKRRYLVNGTEWHYQYVVDSTAKLLIEEYGLNPKDIETSIDLAADPERRIKFQADIQDYVDMSISSTINLPKWGSELNNEDKVEDFARMLAKYAVRLRGFTCYPDGSRGGQPLTSVPYEEAMRHEGLEFKEEAFDVCDISKGGTCGS